MAWFRTGGRNQAVERCRPACLACRHPSGLLEEARGTGGFTVEIPGVQGQPPHRLIHSAQLGYGELFPTERRRQGGILQLGPGTFQPIAEDLLMIEGKPDPMFIKDGAHGVPAHHFSIASRGQDRKVGGEQKVRHGKHVPSRVTATRPITAQLLQMPAYPFNPRLLSQLADSRLLQILARKNKAARQCEPAPVRFYETGDKQDVQDIVAHCQGNDVDSDGKARRRVISGGHGSIVSDLSSP